MSGLTPPVKRHEHLIKIGSSGSVLLKASDAELCPPNLPTSMWLFSPLFSVHTLWDGVRGLFQSLPGSHSTSPPITNCPISLKTQHRGSGLLSVSIRLTMGASAHLEPLAVVTLLFGGAWTNRARHNTISSKPVRWGTAETQDEGFDATEWRLTLAKRSLSPSLLPSPEIKWRQREVDVLEYSTTVNKPNTAVFRNRILSRLLHRFPFLVEAWYWALIY
jgi:hypothetical protein